ncbi:MAG: GNAT family N-acetyltransferase [Firmicutes bacterium]|nr:GNAT family N-acetyltransferase [Bacillota bacterium]
MSVICRKADWKDLPALLQVEHDTMPNHTYLAAVAEKFLDPSQGVLFAAEVDGVVAGVAHLAFLSDGGSWLEVLRVTPALQKNGCGTKIYEEAMKICAEKKLTSIRMYTGGKNVTSRKLAERFGLTLTFTGREGVLEAENVKGAENTGFQQVCCPEQAAKLAEEAVKTYGGYMCTNRTWWQMGDDLWKDLCAQGSLYEKDGSLIHIGARMQLDKGLNIGLISGNVHEAAAFAKDMLVKTGLPRLTAMVPVDQPQLIAQMEAEGFVFPETTIIMLEKKF